MMTGRGPGPRLREIPAGETHVVHAAMTALRQQWTDPEAFVRRVDEVQRPDGYRLVASFEAGAPEAVAVAGFRLGENLAWGRFLYVDDLSTLPEARGRGHAGALLDWLVDLARAEGCDQLHLDSGVGADRAEAHRLYLANRLRITSHHFGLVL